MKDIEELNKDEIRAKEMQESQRRDEYVADLRQKAHDIVKDKPYTAGRLYLIAQDIEDGQPISYNDQQFLKWR